MSYQCPICRSNMVGMYGEKMHPDNRDYGYSLYCIDGKCPAEEVMGHGKNEKEAYDIVMAKFVGRDKSGDKDSNKKK